MATYYVWSGATGANTGTSWTDAYTSFASAVTAAAADGDFIYVHYTHQQSAGSNVTFTFLNNVNVICVNKDNSNAPTPMGTSGWLGNSTASRTVTLTGAYKVYIYGLTTRSGGSAGAGSPIIATADGSHFVCESCYFWVGTTVGNIHAYIGSTSASTNTFVHLISCTFRFAATGQQIIVGATRSIFEGCSVASAGTIPDTLFGTVTSGATEVQIQGCDFSQVTNTLVGSMSTVSAIFVIAQSKLGANVTILATQTPANKSSGAAYVFDCSSGDTHTFMGYYDAFGSCVSDTGIYYTSGAAAQSWKIVTTANCSYYTPFVSPFVDFYNTGTTSITPYIEILRDGSTTAFQNDEIWGEFFVKTTSGSTQSTEYSDRMALLGTPANQAAGAGTGSWTGEAASAWSGKIDSGSAVTPAEAGAIRGRVVVGEPSITVYVDPQIRT